MILIDIEEFCAFVIDIPGMANWPDLSFIINVPLSSYLSFCS